jgi:hypothetical protein
MINDYIEHGTPFLWCEQCTAPWPLTPEEVKTIRGFRPFCPLCGGDLVLIEPEEEEQPLTCLNCYFLDGPEGVCDEWKRPPTQEEITKGCPKHSGFPWFS